MMTVRLDTEGSSPFPEGGNPMRSPCHVVLASVFAGWVLAASAQAQANPLAQIPDQAPIVIQVRGLESKDRLLAMVQTAVPDLGPKVKFELEKAIQKGLADRELKGLAKDGPVFFAFLEMPHPLQDGLPRMALIARVTDYAAFRDGLLKAGERKTLKADPDGFESAKVEDDREYFFVHRKDYAVITPQKNVAAVFAKDFKGLDGKLKKSLADNFLKADAAVYVDMLAVNKTFQKQLEEGSKTIKSTLEDLIKQGGKDEKATVQVVNTVIDGLFQLITDSEAVLFSIRFQPEGLALNLHVQVADDSKANAFLRPLKLSAFKELETLPAGRMIYQGDVNTAAMFKIFGAMATGFPTGEPDSDLHKEIQKTFEQLVAAGPGLSLQGANVVEGLEVQNFADPARAADAYLRLFKTLKKGEEFSGLPVKKLALEENKEAHRGFKFHHVDLAWDYAKAAEDNPDQKGIIEAMKKLMGETVRVWFGTDGKKYVQVTARDWDEAKKLLDGYLDGSTPVGSNKAYLDARKRLPEQTSTLFLVDVPSFSLTIGEFAYGMLKSLGLDVGAAPKELKAEPTFLGFALTLESQRVDMDVWIPAEGVASVRKVFGPIFEALGALQ
jgi:hypothetical protein